ncbi:MAG: U32 family peptidase [Firmicutes bacterium]|nr:U32 family peptidase [Bacillota bacterium]
MTLHLEDLELELLAPVGRWDVLEAVIAAGADAVYLGGKKFNMRMFRDDYNFTDESLKEAIEYAHSRGVKVYVTMNNLQSDEELAELKDYLLYLNEIGPDSLIIQDLGVLKLARDLGLTVPLHASVMMNTHNLETLQFLKKYGVTRVVLNREIPFAEIRRLRDESGLEMEYFIHGDMCIAQSGQCYASGLLFGQSSNRGRCMKPCRWAYEFVDARSGEVLETKADGPYFLALGDMYVLDHIPELVQSGVCSFKIEGRMREAEYLALIVSAYRQAIDAYLEDPTGYKWDKSLKERIYQNRVRDLTNCYALKHPGPKGIGYTGEREPQFFSTGVREMELTERLVQKDPFAKQVAEEGLQPKPALAVKVGDLEALKLAAEAGADRIYFGGEVPVDKDFTWSRGNIQKALEFLAERGIPGVISTPRITMSREMAEYRMLFRWLESLDTKPAGVMVANPGLLQLAKAETTLPLYGDYSLNIFNSKAAELLKEEGLVQVTAEPESSFARVKQLAADSSLPVEALVHGSLTAMVLEHCLPAALLEGGTRQDICSGPCRSRRFALKDIRGGIREIVIDQYCRNHILLANELCTLPFLASFSKLGLAGFRLELPFSTPKVVSKVVKAYRQALDLLYSGESAEVLKEQAKEFVGSYHKPLGLGAYPRGITGLR